MTIEEFNKFKVGDRIYDSKSSWTHLGSGKEKSYEVVEEVAPDENVYIELIGEYEPEESRWLCKYIDNGRGYTLDAYIYSNELKFREFKLLNKKSKKESCDE